MKKFAALAVAVLLAGSVSLRADDKKEGEKGEHKRPELTEEQKKLMKEMTAKYDANKDKKLDKEERAKISAEDKEKMKKAGLGRREHKDGEKKADDKK
jgi:hypothetical protein